MRCTISLSIAFALAACGGGGSSGDDTPATDGGSGSGSGSQTTGACAASWNFTQPATCDRPCIEKPEAHGAQCSAISARAGYRGFCIGTFTFDGHTGCCDSTHRQDDASMPVYFLECE